MITVSLEQMNRFLFELFHIEKQLSKFADEADGHSARQSECEANCKAISKGQDKKNREKSIKDKEWAGFDKKVRDLEKQIKSIENHEMQKTEAFLDGRKNLLSQLEKDIKTIQVDSFEGLSLRNFMRVSVPDNFDLVCAGKSSRCEEESSAS